MSTPDARPDTSGLRMTAEVAALLQFSLPIDADRLGEWGDLLQAVVDSESAERTRIAHEQGRAEGEAAERERIAQAIEAGLVCGCGGSERHGGGICWWGAAAAAIARADRDMDGGDES